jgi:hypothetical protein
VAGHTRLAARVTQMNDERLFAVARHSTAARRTARSTAERQLPPTCPWTSRAPACARRAEAELRRRIDAFVATVTPERPAAAVAPRGLAAGGPSLSKGPDHEDQGGHSCSPLGTCSSGAPAASPAAGTARTVSDCA